MLVRGLFWASVLAWVAYISYWVASAHHVDTVSQPVSLQVIILVIMTAALTIASHGLITQRHDRHIRALRQEMARLVAEIEEYGAGREAHGHAIAVRAMSGQYIPAGPGRRRGGNVYPLRDSRD